MGPGSLHFFHVFKQCGAAGPDPHLENQCFKKEFEEERNIVDETQRAEWENLEGGGRKGGKVRPIRALKEAESRDEH